MRLLYTAAWTFFFCVSGGGGAAQRRFYGEVGRSFSVTTEFPFLGSWRIFCRNNCSRTNILIETKNDSADSGRFSLRHQSRGMFSKHSLLSVGVAALARSDAGLYLCGLLRGSSYDYSRFHIVVVDRVLKEASVQTPHQLLLVGAGRSVRVACSFQSSGNPKYFCRGNCSSENILVQTNGSRTQNGRFSLQSAGGAGEGETVSVSIDPLQRSDSGRFRCSMRTQSWESNIDFYISVTDASPESPDPGSPDSRPPPALPETTTQSEPGQNHRTDLLLPLGGTLAVVVVLLVTALLAVCRKPASRHTGPSLEQEVSVSESVRVNQDEELSSTQGDDDSDRLTYSEVVFSRSGAPGGAPRRTPEDVVYSLPQASRSSEDDPLYSIVMQPGIAETPLSATV